MGEPEKILVVDDEPQVLVALEDVLSERFHVLKADSAYRALEILGEQTDIAVLLTDQRMPRMTGDQLLSQLQWSRAQRILITGFADLNAVVRAVNTGKLFAYVTKPWDPDDLYVKVSNAANHFRLAAKLEHEQRLLQDLMQNSPDGIYFKGPDQRFQRVNRAFSEALGATSPESVLGKTNAEVLADAHVAQAWAEADRRVLESGAPQRDLIRSYPDHGEVCWISETIAPIRGVEGASLGLVGITRDVTERVRVEEALRASEQRFREQTELLNSILDSMGDGVVMADAEGKLVYFNRRAESILGAEPRGHHVEVWAKEYGFFEVDGKTPLAATTEPLWLAVHGKGGAEAEICIRGRQPEPSVVALKATALATPGQSARGGVALLRDVTKQRQLEQQVQQAQKMDAIGRLAGGVAHDFSNLLAVIESYGELLLNNLAADNPARDDVQEILSASQRATSLTRQLLAFSRRQVVQPRRLSLNDVVRDMERMLRRMLGDRIELLFNLSNDLHAIKADPSQMEQVLMNLVINARDAMVEGGRLLISTQNQAPSDQHGLEGEALVVLSVQDTGTGMDEATLSRVFEPFFTTKAVDRGTGLGLATVYGIVNQAKGQIAVKSQLGVGTEFTLYFPEVLDSAVSTTALPAAATRTVLLVEEDAAVRALTARTLEAQGYQVLEAANAEQALQTCQAEKVDLLLIDKARCLVAGKHLLDLLPARPPSLRVLYLSADGQESERPMAPRESYLQRPITPAGLAEKIRQLLD